MEAGGQRDDRGKIIPFTYNSYFHPLLACPAHNYQGDGQCPLDIAIVIVIVIVHLTMTIDHGGCGCADAHCTGLHWHNLQHKAKNYL